MELAQPRPPATLTGCVGRGAGHLKGCAVQCRAPVARDGFERGVRLYQHNERSCHDLRGFPKRG